jgi:hypothetical protein
MPSPAINYTLVSGDEDAIFAFESERLLESVLSLTPVIIDEDQL